MYACLDLGSNSFHLLIANWRDGRAEIIERFSEKVQLGESVTATGMISPQAFQRGVDCLNRFKSLISHYPVENCWAVGTNALRVARNAAQFLEASRAAGFDISIISGIQEAALVYAGVNSAITGPVVTQLVIDIGGGSTELIVGCGPEPLWMQSLPVGCVSWRDEWFKVLPSDSTEVEGLLDHAVAAATAIFQSAGQELSVYNWENTYASSGTAKMFYAVCQQSAQGLQSIELETLINMRPLIIESALTGALLPGLVETRRELILPGWAILTALMQNLALTSVNFSATALREGMLEFMVKHENPALALESLNSFSR
jgi:exopolyphosphatase / guanosine-5'-triphosphate,3'-diphosphate pyrophosphatase